MLTHILWKEYRAQRGLWLAVAACGLIVQVAVRSVWPESANLPTMIAISLVTTVMFTLGSVAMLFAGEAEEDTLRFLQTLPVRPRALFSAKVGFGLVATILLLTTLLIGGWCARNTMLDARPPARFVVADPIWLANHHGLEIYTIIIAAASCFGGGLLASVTSNRVLKAVTWTAIAAFGASVILETFVYKETGVPGSGSALMIAAGFLALFRSHHWLRRETTVDRSPVSQTR